MNQIQKQILQRLNIDEKLFQTSTSQYISPEAINHIFYKNSDFYFAISTGGNFRIEIGSLPGKMVSEKEFISEFKKHVLMANFK